jgi:acyl dehydratase
VIPIRHALAQGPMLRALGELALAAARPRKGGAPPSLPGPWLEAELPPRSPDLVRDYVAACGGDPAAYRNTIPPHLFPQWAFPHAISALRNLPYPFARGVNAGCRLSVSAPIPAGEPLLVRARLESVDDDGRRARVTERVITGTRRAPEAITADLFVHIPLGKARGPRGPRDPKRVPAEAREAARLDVDARAGLEFALLTGDFNPIHWLPPYAKMAGFRSTILHGFGTMARTFEALVRARLGGDPARLSSLEARFVKPLVLPARVAVFTTPEGGVWVGDAPGGDAYLEGRFSMGPQAAPNPTPPAAS